MKKTEKTESKKQIIVNYLLSEISSGHLKVGDQILSEAELVEKFHFGRQTIHNALSDLALKGIINRTPGKGSFVSSKPVNRNIQKKMSFTEDMHNIGMMPGSKLLEYKIISGKDAPEAAEELKITPEETLYYIVRLRTGNGTPIVLQHSYMPTKYIADLNLEALNRSLDAYIADCGIHVTGFITKLRAIEGSDEQIKILGTKNRALLNSVSIRYIDRETPIHYTSSFYRSDLYEYTFSSFNE